MYVQQKEQRCGCVSNHVARIDDVGNTRRFDMVYALSADYSVHGIFASLSFYCWNFSEILSTISEPEEPHHQSTKQ
jgi:hypothetical protein